MSIQQACKVVQLSRNSYYHTKDTSKDEEVITALLGLFENHPTYGFWKMYHMLRRAGHLWNHKRVYRIYLQLKMNIRRRAKRRLPARIKVPLEVPATANQVWSMDLMNETLYDGRRVRILNIIDDYHREILSMEIDTSIPALRIVRTLQSLVEDGLQPKVIRVDNGPEFISAAFVNYCNQQQIEIRYIQPGKPSQNGFIERFNGTYRREVLDAYIFYDLQQVKQISYEWINHYNTKRPQDALKHLSPVEYLNCTSHPLKHTA